MLRNLLIAVALIALLCALLVFVAKRSDEGTPTQGAAAGPVVGEREQSVARWLREMGERSRALMPQELEGVALGMSLDELRRARPRATHDPRAHGPQGEGLWAENADSGARFVYLFVEGARGAEGPRLVQVQALSLITQPAEIDGHFRALHARYGAPSGAWDCPETAEGGAPMRRFTWRREVASVMEALLLHNGRLAVTLVIAATDDIGAALQRSRCRPMRPGEDVASIPVARSLAGAESAAPPGGFRITIPSAVPSAPR